MRLIVILLIAAVGLTACGDRKKDRIAFDDQYFRSKSSKVGDDRLQFVVAVSPVSASLDGAREAGRYEATKYCIEQNGSSKIEWGVGPDTDPETLTISNDTLNFDGACVE